MVKKTPGKLTALLLFAILTFFQLLPLSLHPLDGVNDSKDCLLVTWILAWDQQQILRNPLKLFEANIFYPHKNTLAFSEHLLPLAVISFPLYALTRNPILVYNFVFFLCFLLNAYAMFLLLRHLTKDEMAGIVGGIIFAFSTYHLQHIPHLQLLTSWLIVLSFLFLHRFFENPNWKNSLLFWLFFTLQALSCIYYGLFLIIIFIVALPIFFLLSPAKTRLSLLLKLGFPLFFSLILFIPFVLRYIALFKSFSFERGLTKGADLTSYFAALPYNLLLGKLLSPLGSPENYLFLGFIALMLALFALGHQKIFFRHMPKFFKIMFTSLIGGSLAIVVLIFLTGGFDVGWGRLFLSAHNPAKPAFLALIFVILLTLVSFVLFLRKRSGGAESQNLFFYFILLLWALLLSFGRSFSFLGNSPFDNPASSFRSFPFTWLYESVPGFKGIRVPSRYAVFVLLSLAVLAGYGAAALFSKLKTKKLGMAAAILLIILLNVEYLSIPKTIRLIPVGKEVPPTYRWLSRQQGEGPLIEVPMFPEVSNEAIYMYFSLFHGKKIVNGYSGFIPPAAIYIRRIFQAFPNWASIDILHKLDIRYLVFHPKAWKEPRARLAKAWIQTHFQSDLRELMTFTYDFSKLGRFVTWFGDDIIYEILPEERPLRQALPLIEIPQEQWSVNANIGINVLHSLKDNNFETVWSTPRPKRTNDYLLVEFAKSVKVSEVSLHLGRFINDYASEMKVGISRDGKVWQVVDKCYSPGEFTRCLIAKPQAPIQNIHLDGQEIRFLKITQIGSDKVYPWSIAELKIYGTE